MRIMGIDPGIANVGFGVIKRKHSKTSALVFGTLRTNPRTLLEHRIYLIARKIDVLIDAYGPDVVVLENFTPHRGMSRRKAISGIDKVFGAIVYVVLSSGVRLRIESPNWWMRRFLGLGKSDKFGKMDIRRRVDKLLGIRTKVEHEAEALGMAMSILKGRGK